MTATQHRFVEMLFQSAQQSGAELHEGAWVILGALLLASALGFCAIWLWVLNGGLGEQRASCFTNRHLQASPPGASEAG